MMLINRSFIAAALLGTAASAAFALAGCGGATANNKTYSPTAAYGPAIYGLSPSLADSNLSSPTDAVEVSGLTDPASGLGYFTAVEDKGFATVAGNGPKAVYLVQKNSDGSTSLPEGFSYGGEYIDEQLSSVGGAAVPGGTYQFRVNISNGQAISGSIPQITESSVKLTSTDPQWTLGTLQMTFDTHFGFTGPLANGTYVTGTNGTATSFTLPFTTSGLHPVTVTASDSAGNTTATTFQILVLAPASAALFAQAVVVPDTSVGAAAGATVYTSIAPGDTVELTDPANPATVIQTVTADPTGTAIFIAPPGSYGLVDVTQTLTNSSPLSLTAGKTTDQFTSTRRGTTSTSQVPA